MLLAIAQDLSTMKKITTKQELLNYHVSTKDSIAGNSMDLKNMGFRFHYGDQKRKMEPQIFITWI